MSTAPTIFATHPRCEAREAPQSWPPRVEGRHRGDGPADDQGPPTRTPRHRGWFPSELARATPTAYPFW